MKYLLILFSLCCLTSCKTTKKDKTIKQENQPQNNDFFYTFEQYKDQTLVIKKDDIGKIYYQKEDSKGKTVFSFNQEKNKNLDYMDGNYTEEIIFELENSVFDQSFNDLKPEKALFGVFCYCKEKAGYYPTENTLISFDKNSKTLTIILEQIIENQILKTIKLDIESK